jgi:hypothetical protein
MTVLKQVLKNCKAQHLDWFQPRNSNKLAHSVAQLKWRPFDAAT